MAKFNRPRDANGKWIVQNREEKLWSRIQIGSANECWPWLSAVGRDGYGIFYEPNGSGKYHVAHRVSWEALHGPIPKGAVLRHTCDNPPCCNPAHLVPGSQGDNIADKVLRGRQAKGETIHTAKMTAEGVIELRLAYRAGTPVRELMTTYGLSRGYCYRLARGDGWRHLEGVI